MNIPHTEMLKKTVHIIPGILLFLTTTGMSIDLHYCNRMLFDIGVFAQADPCCEPLGGEHNDIMHQHCNMNRPATENCEDEILEIRHVDDYMSSSFRYDFNNLLFIHTFSPAPVHEDIYRFPEPTTEKFRERNTYPAGHRSNLSLLQTYLL